MTLHRKSGFITKTRLYVTFLLVMVITALTLMYFTDVQAQAGETVFGVLEPAEVAPGSTVQVAVSVRGIEGLYAVDFALEYDPAVVQLVDVDENLPGIQAGLGTFLDPGLLLINDADNQTGEYHFVMSQYNPSQPKSGDGNIVVLTFKGISAGESPIHITKVELLDGDITAIEAQVTDSTIKVMAGAATRAATIAVAQATGLIIVEESTPTPTVTMTVSPTGTPEPQSSQEPAAGAAGDEAESENGEASSTGAQTGSSESGGNATGASASDASGSWLEDTWWLLIVVLAVLLAGGVYFLGRRKKSMYTEENNEGK